MKKILINIIIFLLVGGFVWYMVYSVGRPDAHPDTSETTENDNFVSPYRQVSSFDVDEPILSLELYNGQIYVSKNEDVTIFDLQGKVLSRFAVNPNSRDIAIKGDSIYLLYPTQIEVYSLSGKKLHGWSACSDNSDYCSIALSDGYVYTTDAENKNICQYTHEGNFKQFIESPAGFVIPSYSFDITNINDTLYCANSGRHSIESYTLDGEYITAFGESGEEAGAFAGCCNPAYLSQTSTGDILTSEKGNPRISCYDKNGKFRTILLTGKLLGGGNEAYEVKVLNDLIVTTGNEEIRIFRFDSDLAAHASCAGCTADCPLRKNVRESRLEP